MNVFVGVLFLYFLSKATCFLIFDINNPHLLDEENPVADDICSPEIELPVNGISFYNQIYRSLLVCNNGILSFNSADTRYAPEAFPIEGSSLIAVFWGDVDNRGTIEGVEGINRIIRRVDTSPTTTETINAILKQNTDTENFDALWGLVVTWHEVGYLPHKPTSAILFKSFWRAMRNQYVSVCLHMKKSNGQMSIHNWVMLRLVSMTEKVSEDDINRKNLHYASQFYACKGKPYASEYLWDGSLTCD